MDFFQRQAESRNQSRRFFIAFAISVVLATMVFYFIVTVLLGFCGVWWDAAHRAAGRGPGLIAPPPASASLTELLTRELPRAVYGSPPRVLAARPLAIVGLSIFALIAGVSLYKIRAVKNGGGFYVAIMLGGRLLEKPGTPKEKQLVNVVEEMAVAAGLPRPEIFILEQERAINAVTAGLEPEDAVIAVTAGALEYLDRDELQAVVAHEFAHILNGDCALNLTLVGWLHGLLVFYLLGKKLLLYVRVAAPSRRRRGGGALLVGALLLAGGWLGKLCAELTQAALSRSREYLADAFAAQFTRNPGALAGALKKIAVAPQGLRSGQAAAMQTFFIASPFRGFFRSHPPLEDRIWALEPEWDGVWPALKAPAPPRRRPAEALKERPLDWAGVSLLALAGAEAAPNLAEAGRNLYASLPESLRAAALDPALAPVLSAAVFIQNEEPEVAGRQGACIKAAWGTEAAARALEFSLLLTDETRTPLLDLAAPALKRLPPEAKAVLSGLIKSLIAADGRLSLFEVAAARILQKSLGLTLTGRPAAAEGFSVARLQSDAALFLSALAHAGAAGPGEAAAAFQAGQRLFSGQWPPLTLTPRDRIKTQYLPPLLDRLAQAPEKIKARLAAAAVAAIMADGLVTPGEYALAKALAAALDITLPLRG